MQNMHGEPVNKTVIAQGPRAEGFEPMTTKYHPCTVCSLDSYTPKHAGTQNLAGNACIKIKSEAWREIPM